jgi:gliding motility-associated protein GldE
MNSLANIAFIISSLFFYDKILNEEEYPYLKLAIDTLFVTLLILIFGEVIPKVYATRNYRKTANLLAFPMSSFVFVLWPFTAILEKLGRVLEKSAGKGHSDITPEEITEAIELTSNESAVDQETEILKGIVNMSSIQVKQIMCPRLDIVALENSLNYNEVLSVIREDGFSRMPVYRENLDTIEGILNVKNLLPYIDEDDKFKWSEHIFKPYFVPENKPIDDLLNEFQQNRLHMAIVVDEFGGTSGLVTLEDLLEEVFGDLKDEFDDEESEFEKINEATYIFEGKTPIVDVLRELGLPHDYFADLKIVSDSVAGLVSEEMGKIPRRNERIKLKDLLFIVEAANPKKVKKVKIVLPQNENSSI